MSLFLSRRRTRLEKGVVELAAARWQGKPGHADPIVRCAWRFDKASAGVSAQEVTPGNHWQRLATQKNLLDADHPVPVQAL
jgi:hypothetical protein